MAFRERTYLMRLKELYREVHRAQRSDFVDEQQGLSLLNTLISVLIEKERKDELTRRAYTDASTATEDTAT
jgi:hypothetical protein